MNIDLHCHSTASDGKLAPLEVLALAVKEGVEVFSITDHDSVAGIREVLRSDAAKPPFLVTGIELSTQCMGAGIHIIGLDFTLDAPAIAGFIERQRNVRKERAEIIDQRLAKKGMPDVLTGALHYCPDLGQVGRPHFAQAMVDKGYVKTVNQAFDRWLGNGKLGDVKNGWPEMAEAVAAINAAGGVAVLAHPLKYKMTFSKLQRLMQAFKEAGGQAVEVIDSQADKQQLKRLQQLAGDLQLAASAGSDFHSPDWAWAQLGKVAALPENLTPVWQLFRHTCIA
jgi:predicted metal-dependent phosphoesterase TrpH